MKRIVIAALMLIVALSVPLTSAQGKKTMSNKASLEKTVNTFFQELKASNFDKVRDYYTADYSFTGPDGKLMSAQERLAMLKDRSGNTFNEASNITVRTYGNTGVVTGIASTTTPSGSNERSRFLQVWTWQGGRWRLAASQVTNIV
ncbi:MAG: nuclear transport factor 2 family protein [Acidobacteriota bacterium]|nr:nuclear transport factor 2 family protein [Acidobacteriota bacterium]